MKPKLVAKKIALKPTIYVTTSWDDGHKLDVRLAALLRKYNMPGTFFISPFDREFKQEDLLTTKEIIGIAKDFEIGAHTMTHPVLTRVPLSQAKQEIVESRKYLQKITKQPVYTFCYPRGAFSQAHADIVRDAGFRTARTVSRHRTTLGTDPMHVPTTIHGYKHYSDIFHIIKGSHLSLPTLVRRFLNWDQLAIELFDELRTANKQAVFHLWGHSWELDNNSDWERLERVLNHISKLPDVYYGTNDAIARVRGFNE